MRRTIALCAGLVACNDVTTEADFTGARVNVVSPSPIQIEVLQLSGLVGTEPAFVPSPRAVPLRTNPDLPPSPFTSKDLAIVLDARFVGGTLVLTADAIDQGAAIVATGVAQIPLRLGVLVTSTITLGQQLSCGDRRLDDGELCDDGNVSAGDGCDPRCRVEADFICAGAPSRCSRAAITAVVDDDATCPGNGTLATPFCSPARAFEVPWPEVVVIRAGLYDERLEIDHDLRVEAEPGAIVSETTAPVLIISGGEVEITGLSIQGGSRSVGGGIEVRGAQTEARLKRLDIGPGSAVGIVASDGAYLELTESRIARHESGGLELGDVQGYVVENNLIIENGSERSAFGGATILSAPIGSVFAFNTVAANLAATSTTAGLHCFDPATPVDAILVWDNGTVTASIAAACDYDYSDLGPLAPGVTLAGTNFSADPDLDSTFHLGPDSGCIDRADPSGTIPAVDYDGQDRPLGPGPDVGADERG